MLHRPVSGYVPEEIWKKAGEPPLSRSLYLAVVFKTFCSVEIKAIFFDQMPPPPSHHSVVCCLQLPPLVYLN